MKKFKPSVRYHEGLIRDLKDPAEAIEYLNTALEEGDIELFLTALRNVAEARGGMTKASRQARLNRVSLYKMLSKHGNPEIQSLARLLNVWGMKFLVTDKRTERFRKAA